MDAERTSLDSSGEVASFEGLLEELDDLRARLLDQYKREIAQQPQSRTLTAAPSVRLSIAARPDIPTLLVPDSSYPSPRASQASGGEPQGTLRVSHAGVAPKSSIWSRASLSPGSPAQDQEVIKWCQSERFHLLDSWRNKVPAAKLAEFEPEPQKGRPAMSLFSHIVRQSSRLSVKLSGGPATTRLSSGPFSAVLVHPQSPLVTAWSIFSLVLIAYDTVTVPLFTFYRFERFPKAVEIMDWVARAFWTMDIPLSSATGFHTEGYVEMRPRRVFQAYLTSWFLFDLFVISADWLWVALYYQTALSAMSVMRGLRLVRVLRLLRLRWFTYLIDEVLLWLCDGVTILVRLVKLTGGLCITVHLLASIWFGLGTISSAGWVSQEPFLDSAALLAQYTMSLSWVVTQLHGTSLVRPQTLLEIQFQTLVLLIAYAFAAVFMASMVQLMMAITNAQSLQMQYICRRYLRRRRISPELSHKLQLHFGRMGNGTSLEDGHEEENRLVESLPLDLQRQLYEEVRLPLLSSTRLFRTSGICNYRLLRRLCCDVLSGVCQKPGEVVFTCGDSCSRMLVVESGTGVYTPVQATRDSASMTSTIRSSNSLTVLSEVSVSGQKTQVQRGQCLCEASLWTWWTNRGELSAEGDCTMLAVDQEGFASVVSSHESSYMATLRYASCYVLWLNERIRVLSRVSRT
ncbi:unnamed protein product [Prorocentrum cordatum]|uniref:Ion transport domain-containing protein n=1 Tax=Prorocentrum cordatum TaxID=2364126 RepID=A0ABN9XKZ4_9DINO|nr:unnamed protein product [Polarella glacialis]